MFRPAVALTAVAILHRVYGTLGSDTGYGAYHSPVLIAEVTGNVVPQFSAVHLIEGLSGI